MRAATWETPFPDEATVPQLFAAQVALHAGDVAIVTAAPAGDAPMTYATLNARANQLAHVLASHGIGAGSIVPIVAERSPEMIIGTLAIMKAGGAYLPIVPGTPPERMRYMVDNAGAQVMLVQNTNAASHGFAGTLMSLGDPALGRESTNDLPQRSGPGDLAYVIYTSGSTGRPKGVMVEHRALINRLDWMQRAYPIGTDDVILQKTPFAFDVSVWELLWWAVQGTRVCLLPPGGEKNPLAIADAIQRHRVTVLHFVPSMLNAFLEYFNTSPGRVEEAMQSLRRVFASGEALTPSHVKKFNEVIGKPTGARLTNLYGPTEATVDVTHYDCPSGGSIEAVPIGKPIQNTRIYVLRGDREVPVGEAGELCIAGAGLARGYLNDTSLTAAKFTDNPVRPGERIYRTGDIGRLRADGNIEYIGREDHQVKIRGMRIELGEIESVVREHPSVADCVVTVREHGENVVLIVAHLVCRTECDAEGLREYLRQRLPAYMIPNRFEIIESVPTTPNGKANRSALPVPFAVAEFA